VQTEGCPTCDSALEVWGVWNVNQLLNQHLNRPEEKEEDAEYKAALLGALKGLEAARKYICQFDTKNKIIVMFNKIEN
jgi:hypothetical protein